MNNKQMVDDMLAQFAESFTQFREDFHNIVNEVQNNDMRFDRASENPNIARIEEEISKTKFQIEYDERKLAGGTLSEVETSQTNDRIAYNRELIENKQKELDEINAQSKQDSKDNVERLKGYREALKDAIKKMREAIQTVEVNGRSISNIDVIKQDISTQLNIIEFNIVSAKKRLEEAKGKEKAPIIRELQELGKRRKELLSLFNCLTAFVERLEKMEKKYIERNSYVDIFDLFSETKGYDTLFEELANALGNKDDLSMSINIIKNEDGTYSIDMRCGNKFAEPRPLLQPDELTKDMIDKLLLGFAAAIARKSDFSEDLVKASDVLIKSNGEEIGTVPFDEVGKTVQEKEVGKEAPAQEAPAPGAPVPPEEAPAPGAPVPPEEAPAPGAPVPPEEAPAPGAPVPPEEAPAPGAPVPPEEAPAPGAPVDRVNHDKINQIYRVVESRKATRRTIAMVGLLTAAGLGLATAFGAPLAVPALIAAGAGTTFEAMNYIEDGVFRYRRRKVEKKLQKLAKSINCELKYDYENRTAAFYKLNEDGEPTNVKIESQDLGIIEGHTHINVQEELDKIFNNAHRGVESPVTATDYQYQGFSKVTVDNLEAAFEEFYGVLTKDELNAKFQFNLPHLIGRGRGEATVENVGDLSEEEIEQLLPDGAPVPPAEEAPAPGAPVPPEEAPAPGAPVPPEEAPAPGAPVPPEEAPAPGAPVPPEEAPAPGAPVPPAEEAPAPGAPVPPEEAPAPGAPVPPEEAPAPGAPVPPEEAPAPGAPVPPEEAPAPGASDSIFDNDKYFENVPPIVTSGLADQALARLIGEELGDEGLSHAPSRK